MPFYLSEFKSGSQDYEIAKLLLQGKTREEVIRELFPLVARKRPFIYRENVGGGRRPKPRMDQYRLFLYNVARTMGKMKASGWEYNTTETLIQRKRWESKERVYVKWRSQFIDDLIREGVIAHPDRVNEWQPPENTPKPDLIPEPGSVKPVDPQGNPLFTQDDLQEMFDKLSEDNLMQLVDEVEDSEEEEEYEGDFWEEYNENNKKVADWTQTQGTWNRKKVSEAKGKYEDDYNAIVGVPVVHPPEPEPEPVKTRVTEIARFYELMMKARDFVMSRELNGEYLDFISTRALKDGCKAIAYGISVEEVMEAITKTWPQDSKNELKHHNKIWKPKPWTIDVKSHVSELEGAHACLGYVEKLAHARIPVFLVGPSGSGKSFMARDLADSFEVEYGELPLTAGATPSWLVGAETITGYKSRPFVEIYAEGGVFCFEEIDAADPNMLLLVNNALANESFTNPVTGEEIPKNKNFIPVATANTWGLGANRTYTGRERLDAATLDRWRVGRVEVDYDQGVEQMIVAEWKEKAAKFEKPKKAKKKVKVYG